MPTSRNRKIVLYTILGFAAAAFGWRLWYLRPPIPGQEPNKQKAAKDDKRPRANPGIGGEMADVQDGDEGGKDSVTGEPDGKRKKRRNAMGPTLEALFNRANKNAPYGTSPPVDPNASPQARSVFEALETGKYPERLAPLAPIPLFDREEYLKDPDAYLNIAVPGRVYQVAQPEKGVHALVRLSRPLVRVEQGESVDLAVKAEPKMPVTFTSFNLGQFPDRLSTMSVAADERGIARTTFTASGGTNGDTRILAGSPTSSGQVEFVIVVSPPAK